MNREHPYAALVRAKLAGGELSGRDLRARLNRGRCWFFRWSAAGFYRLMADLEAAGVVARRIEVRAGGPICLLVHHFRTSVRHAEKRG